MSAETASSFAGAGQRARATAQRLSQARSEVRSVVVADLTDAELFDAIHFVSVEVALSIALGGRRGARTVARAVPTWPEGYGAKLCDLWQLLVEMGDREGVEALVRSLDSESLVVALAHAPEWLSWQVLDERLVGEDDDVWVTAVVSEQTHIDMLIARAVERGQVERVTKSLASDGVDTVFLLGSLINTVELTPDLARAVDTHYDHLLARYGQVHEDRLELTMTVNDSTTAEVLARSSHAGLRRVAAACASSDALLRARLLADDDPLLDGALCRAPLNGSEIATLMQRLRRRDSVPREAQQLLFQYEPLSTRDRLWLLRESPVELALAWLGGESAQDPRPGEIELLVGKEPWQSASAETRRAFVHAARDAQWFDELERSLYGEAISS